MPSLFRFLFVVALMVGLAYAGMIALLTFVEPQSSEMSQTILPAKLNK